MSTALVKELLLDLAQHRVNIDTRSDLLIAIEETYRTGMYTLEELKALDLYLQGYTVEEIANIQQNFSDKIQDTLERLFTTIAELSGYSDDLIIQRAISTPGYRESKLPEFKRFLQTHSTHFANHAIILRV